MAVCLLDVPINKTGTAFTTAVDRVVGEAVMAWERIRADQPQRFEGKPGSTIATQLYNAKEPLSLFELQQWLGHRSISSTQYYAKISPTKLAKSYTDAGYFERNVRTIEVLIDREAILSGAAAAGAPWQYFDLGHGYCTNSFFFVTCPHRMACARCDFYLPKGSSQAQILEAKSVHMKIGT